MSCYRHTKEYCGCHWLVLGPCGFPNGGHRAYGGAAGQWPPLCDRRLQWDQPECRTHTHSQPLRTSMSADVDSTVLSGSCSKHLAWRAGINYSPLQYQTTCSIETLVPLVQRAPPLHGHACKPCVTTATARACHVCCMHGHVPRVLYVSECARGQSTCHVSCTHARSYVCTYVCMHV